MKPWRRPWRSLAACSRWSYGPAATCWLRAACSTTSRELANGAVLPTGSWRPTGVLSSKRGAALITAACSWQRAAGTRPQAELDRALSMTADTGRGPRTEALTALAELRLRQGEPEAALGLLEEADATPWGAVTQAACLIAVGRADEARTLLHGELALHDRKDPAFPAMVAALVEADLSTGRLDEASALVAPGGARLARASLSSCSWPARPCRRYRRRRSRRPRPARGQLAFAPTSSHGSSCLTKPHAQNSTSLASWPHPTTTPPWPGRDLHTGGLRHSAHDEKRPEQRASCDP